MSALDDEAMRIAGTLTKAQRERLLGEEDGNCPAGVAMAFVTRDLIEAKPHDPEGWQWSMLGLRVRASLQNGGTGDDA